MASCSVIIEDWTRICALVMAATSEAYSVSRIADSLAVRFSRVIPS